MANLVRVDADRVELPHLHRSFPLTPAPDDLQAGLAAFRTIQRDLSLQSLPLAHRREVSGFLRSFGQLLHRTLFESGAGERLAPRSPLLLQLAGPWAAYPWELLHDGETWLALERGVIRVPDPPVRAVGQTPPETLPLRLLAVTALPLPDDANPELTGQEQRLGTRFISVPWNSGDAWDDHLTGIRYQALPHASRNELAHALRQSPHVLHFSGFAHQAGWLLESPLLEPEPVDLDWLRMQIEAAVAKGLRLVLVNDSVGLLQPALAEQHHRALLGTGLAALIRIRGRLARLREQDYLRTLGQSMAGGFGVFESHVNSLRRLHRRFEEGWDWSFLQLHAAAPAAHAGATLDVIAAEPQGDAPRPVSFVLDGNEAADPRGTMLPPPRFCGRRRVRGRHGVLRALARGLYPDQPYASGAVYLWGGAGSGKTALAMDIAARMHRQFDVVVYLHPGDLLPASADIGVAPPGDATEPDEFALLGRLACHLGLHTVTALPPEEWSRALRARLEDGRRRLFILDRLDGHGGFNRLVRLLSGLPPGQRTLVLTRTEPPREVRLSVALAPLDDADMERIHGPELAERIAASPLARPLGALCRQDLLLGRILRRLPVWPTDQLLRAALADAGPGGPGRALLALAFAAALDHLSPQARQVLTALALYTHLVHRDVLATLTELEGKPLGSALAELQWLGLVDSYQDDAYLALPPRLFTAAAEQLVDGAVYEHWRPRMLRSALSWLAEVQRHEGDLPGPGTEDAGIAWCWRPHGAALTVAQARLQQRLAVERSHLAELAALLEGEQAVGELGALVQTSDALARCPITADVHRRLLHTQYALGVALGDAGRQAEALNRLAAPLIAGSRYAAAQPLLEQVLHLAGRDTMPWDTLADTYGRLSHCYIQLGQADAAGNMLQASLELARQLGNGMRLVEALSGMLHLWKLRGESLAQGQQMLTQNIAELTERNQPMAVARLRGLLAEVHLERGETTDAARLLQEALATLRTERDGEGLYHILLGLAQVSLAKEDAAQAAHYYAEAQACRPPHQDDLYESDVLAQLCALQERRGLYDDAVASYERLQERYERRGDREGLIAVLDAVGGLYYQLGRQEESILCYQRRLQLLEHGDPAPATHRSA